MKMKYLECNNEDYRGCTNSDVVWIKYADESYLAVIYDKKDGQFSLRPLRSKEALESLCENGGIPKSHCRQIRILGGTYKSKGLLINSTKETAGMLRADFEQLRKMLALFYLKGDGTEVIRLFSLILAGYVGREIIKKNESLFFYRTPIVQVTKHKCSLIGGFEDLALFVDSLTVDTSQDFEIIGGVRAEFQNPAVMPTKRSAEQIQECANIKLTDGKMKCLIPTVYKDAIVLIHSYFFSHTDIERFVHRNRWATIILFNDKSEWKGDIVSHIDLNRMSLPDWEWEPEKVRELMGNYLAWLSRQNNSEDKEVLRSWSNIADEAFMKYELVNGAKSIPRKKGSERAMLSLQIQALHSFLAFCEAREVISVEERTHIFGEWLNLLMPGSMGAQQYHAQKAQKAKTEYDEVRRLLDEFKKLLHYILTYMDGKYVRHVKGGEWYANSNTLDLDEGPWAYLTWTKLSGKFQRILKVRRSDLITIGKQCGYLATEEDVNMLLKHFRDSKMPKEETSFVHTYVNVHFKFPDQEGAQPGFQLYVDQLDFLSREEKKNLKDKFLPRNDDNSEES